MPTAWELMYSIIGENQKYEHALKHTNAFRYLLLGIARKCLKVFHQNFNYTVNYKKFSAIFSHAEVLSNSKSRRIFSQTHVNVKLR